MRQVDKKKKKDRVAATIMLCFCLIALTSIFTIKASIDKISNSANNLPVAQEAPTKQTDAEEIPPAEDETTGSDTVASQEEDDTAEEASAEIPTVDSRETDSDASQYLCPMDMEIAEVAKSYSMDMVIYNMTLDQYMTHPGIDIEGPMKSGVKAIADGTVTDIYEDDAYGTTIVITHEGGIVSKYSNLETGKLIEKGDPVTKGQQISTIGQTALYESMDKCHLHFELYKDGELVNPTEYIPF